MNKIPNDTGLTLLIRAAAKGEKESINELWPKIYKELHGMANFYFRRVNSNATLNPTALVSELYLKLIGKENMRYEDRIHFFAMAATVMRGLLVDHARKTYAQKRGGKDVKLVFEEKFYQAADGNEPLEVLVIHDLLTQLAKTEPELAKVAELKYFAGMNNQEMAQALNTSEGTIKRRWSAARLWLYHEITESKKRKAG